MAAKRCVITLGISDQPPADHPQIVRDFRPGIRRLESNLTANGYEGDFAFWDDEYPKGCPPHREIPYAFKPFCFLEVASQGYEVVLWLDAGLDVISSIEPLFQCIEHDGYIIFAENHSVGEYCKDDALATLGITREESFAMPCCRAGALGLDLRNARSREFLQKWQVLAMDGITFPGPRWSGVRGFPATASTDPRVKGHRHDQTAASVLALRLGMNKWRTHDFFQHFLRIKRRLTPTRSARITPAQVRGTDVTGAALAASRPSVLFFSRGRGRGHAIPDVAIAGEMLQLNREIDLQFVSYATGADTLRNLGWSVYDLGLPEANPFLTTLSVVHGLIRDLQPTVVIAHEEYAVLVAAQMAEVPCIFLTDWFPLTQPIMGEAVGFADSIVFMGEPGIFPLPVPVRRAPIYVGPVVRKMSYSLIDRPKARAELGLSENAFVVSVIPGAWATEEKSPIAQIVLPAFRQLVFTEKHLLWLTTADYDNIGKQAAGIPQVRAVRDCPAVEQVMVASDVIITKGNRGTIIDAASLGVPSISLSSGANPIDDILVARIRSNRALNVKAIDAASLRGFIEELAAIPVAQRAEPLGWHIQGGAKAAKVLLDEIDRLTRFKRLA
jgi:hypothetical protein